MKKPTADLLTALKSEVLGEAFFRSAYYATLFSENRKLKALWQLEAQTKSRILGYYQANSIEIPKLRWLAFKGSVIGVFYSLIPSRVFLKAIAKETEYYLEVFRRLENAADAREKELFEYIVAHEMAIQRFAKIELCDRNNNSLEAIAALLND